MPKMTNSNGPTIICWLSTKDISTIKATGNCIVVCVVYI